MAYMDLADFHKDFDLFSESERFKLAVTRSRASDIRGAFINSRKNHIKRYDYESL